MSTIKNFLKEASLRGNKATGDEYLNDIDRRAAQDVRNTEQRLGAQMGQFMQMVGAVRRMQDADPRIKPQLEELAKDTILAAYGSILGDTILNIKFPKQNDIQQMMEPAPMEPTPMKKLEDQAVIDEIQKRKIANNITQGEAKNVKKMFVMPEVREGLIRIFGEQAGLKYLDLITKITDIATAMDWRIPMEFQKQMWERDKGGFAGSVKVEWEQPNQDEDLAAKVLKDLEEGDIENSAAAEEAIDNMQPTINALGTDFAMLLHETVKGIYELIASAGIPEDEETAQTVIGNTDTLSDEIEDLRYGPYLAADLRDFINSFPGVSEVENMREFIFGKLMLMPAQEFLAVMKGIFTKDPQVNRVIQDLIDEVKQEINDWELGNALGHDNGSDDEESYDDYGFTTRSREEEHAAPSGDEPDYASMSSRELDAAIDAALDAGDYATLDKISKFMKR